MPTTSDYERMVRWAGLRVTRPRLAVLSVVHHQPHADTDWIITAVRKEFGRVSRQAVHDVLHALTAAGLVRRFQPSGSVGYDIGEAEVICWGRCPACPAATTSSG